MGTETCKIICKTLERFKTFQDTNELDFASYFFQSIKLGKTMLRHELNEPIFQQNTFASKSTSAYMLSKDSWTNKHPHKVIRLPIGKYDKLAVAI